MDPINLYDYEALAREAGVDGHDYYASGAHDEITLRENHAAYDRIRLRYRVLRDINRRRRGTVLGHSLNIPVMSSRRLPSETGPPGRRSGHGARRATPER